MSCTWTYHVFFAPSMAKIWRNNLVMCTDISCKYRKCWAPDYFLKPHWQWQTFRMKLVWFLFEQHVEKWQETQRSSNTLFKNSVRIFCPKYDKNILSQTTIIKLLQSWCFFIWRIPHYYPCTHLLAELSRMFWSSSGEEVWLALRNIITWALSPPSGVLLVKLCSLLPKNQSEISDDRNTVSTCNGWVTKICIQKPQETYSRFPFWVDEFVEFDSFDEKLPVHTK